MKRGQLSRALTLIELIVVVAILAILAGLLLPKLDRFQLKANKGVAAANMADISRYIQQYRIEFNEYPNRWDSLIDTTAGDLFTAATTDGPGLNPQLVGGPVAGSPTKLTTTTIADNSELRSFARMGIDTVFDQPDGSMYTGSPNAAFNTLRTLAVGGTYATVNAADPSGDGLAIIQHFYPQTGAVPSGKKLAVFGLGSNSDMVGQLLQEVPFYSNSAPQYYTRYLAVFEIDSGGSRAELLGVLGADGDRFDEEINDYYERENR